MRPQSSKSPIEAVTRLARLLSQDVALERLLGEAARRGVVVRRGKGSYSLSED